MSLCRTLQIDVESKAPASKFHELIHKRPHRISNISSDKVQGCDLHEGEWGKVGSIICWNYIHDGKAKVGKNVIEAVDEERNLITFKVIEGDLLEDYKTFKYTIQAIPKVKGSILRLTLDYEKRHENIADSYTLLELFADIAKDVEAHLIKGN